MEIIRPETQYPTLSYSKVNELIIGEEIDEKVIQIMYLEDNQLKDSHFFIIPSKDVDFLQVINLDDYSITDSIHKSQISSYLGIKHIVSVGIFNSVQIKLNGYFEL